MGIEDGELDGILGEAFKNTADDGVLSTIERLHGAGSSILLREAEEDASPVMLRRSEDGAARIGAWLLVDRPKSRVLDVVNVAIQFRKSQRVLQVIPGDSASRQQP